MSLRRPRRAFGCLGLEAPVLQAHEGREQRLWQRVPGEPAPRRTLRGLTQLRLASNPLRQDEQRDVVLPLGLEQVVAVRTGAQRAQLEPGLLGHLPARARL